MIKIIDSQGKEITVKHYNELNNEQQEKIKLFLYQFNYDYDLLHDDTFHSVIIDFMENIFNSHIWNDSIKKYEFDIEGTQLKNVTVSFIVYDNNILQLLSHEHYSILNNNYNIDISDYSIVMNIIYNAHSTKPQFIIESKKSLDMNFYKDLLKFLDEDITSDNEKLSAINEFAMSEIQKLFDNIVNDQLIDIINTPEYTTLDNLKAQYDVYNTYYFYDDCSKFNCDDNHIYKVPFLGGNVETII